MVLRWWPDIGRLVADEQASFFSANGKCPVSSTTRGYRRCRRFEHLPLSTKVLAPRLTFWKDSKSSLSPTPSWTVTENDPLFSRWVAKRIRICGVMGDAYSKWLEVYTMPATTSKHVIDVLRSLLPTFALPKILFSDNAPNLASNKINKFLKKKKKKRHQASH